MIDGKGIYGLFLHYAFLFSLFGGALIAFCYLWVRKRLDFDDELKHAPFRDDHE